MAAVSRLLVEIIALLVVVVLTCHLHGAGADCLFGEMAFLSRKSRTFDAMRGIADDLGVVRRVDNAKARTVLDRRAAALQ